LPYSVDSPAAATLGRMFKQHETRVNRSSRISAADPGHPKQQRVPGRRQSVCRAVAGAPAAPVRQRYDREVDGRDEKIAALEKALAETALDPSISRAINATYERKVGPLAPGKSTT
jgi:hypothetical protein